MYDRVRVALDSPDWFRRAIDVLVSALLFRLPIALRRQLFGGGVHFCPLCECHVRGFLELHRPTFRWCPVCRSLQRHRLIWLLLQRRIIAHKQLERVLHIAPEQALTARLRQLAKHLYLSADLFDPHAQVRINIERLPFADAAFDLTLCSHVLEHIPDDQRAMAELWRTLVPGGVAIVLVPLLGEHTFEDPTIVDPRERERVFGQFDHVRWYGTDIVDRLAHAGFSVEPIALADIATAAEMRHYGLSDEGSIMLCRRAQPATFV